ncbi:MAG TPA: hypothetical protein VK756_06745 [Solirubrobacteraceae bacterium]|jgi:hypothetical protein|nr:hypothetical protein [Solirubrobacteraceae bacterium]
MTPRTKVLARPRQAIRRAALRFAAVALAVVVPAVGVAQAAPAPVKEIFSSQITNGFSFPTGVAVNDDPASPDHNDIYVTDLGHHRVQVLTASGVFVAMFGLEVNQTKTQVVQALRGNGETPTEKELEEENLCTAASGDTCQEGEGGENAEALREPEGIAIDPNSGDVYVQDFGNSRVDEYTAEGKFILTVGREVNETEDHTIGASETEKNICTAVSKDTCKEGIRREPESSEHDAFDFAQGGDMLTVGGPEDLLYVGEEHRVQELKPNGEWAGEFPVSGTISALAIDNNNDTVYAVYVEEPVIHEFDAATGAELASSITVPGATSVSGVAVDPTGRLAASVYEFVERPQEQEGEEKLFGDLYEASDGHLISTIAVPSSLRIFKALSFSENGDLYASAVYSAVLAYNLKPVGEVLASPATCAPGPLSGSSLTLACTLNGEVNPQGVSETEAFFEWGSTPGLGQQTARVQVEAPEAVHAVVVARPNETIYYQLVGYDHNVKAPEDLLSETLSKRTPSVAPRIVGTPTASFVSSFSAELLGEVNPENTNTTYAFQYAPACNATEDPCPPIAEAPGIHETTLQQSPDYGPVGTTAEITGLQPATTYRYTLTAKNAEGQAALSETGSSTLPQGTFTTGPAPSVAAATGAPSAVTTTSALISGSVSPGGQPATYIFELGVYIGASTVYGVVLSGTVPAETQAAAESEQLTGLQPGTTYAYRITIRSGYGEATGTSATFTTEGLPAILTSPPTGTLLPTPSIAFPNTTAPSKDAKAKKEKTKHKKTKHAARKQNKRTRARHKAAKQKK